MPYEILTFIGDFPLAGQPNWDRRFETYDEAIRAAKEQHVFFKIEDSNEHYTMIIDLDKDEEDDVVWVIYKDSELTGILAQEQADKLAYGECP
jgi:hypothetical protein